MTSLRLHHIVASCPSLDVQLRVDVYTQHTSLVSSAATLLHAGLLGVANSIDLGNLICSPTSSLVTSMHCSPPKETPGGTDRVDLILT